MHFKPHIIQFFDFTPCAFFMVPFLWWLGLPVVISHHSRIDLYATYVPGFIGDYSPQVMRAACEVVFPLVTGHLLIDGNQREQSWFSGHSNIRFWSTGCDLDFFHPSKKDSKAQIGTQPLLFQHFHSRFPEMYPQLPFFCWDFPPINQLFGGTPMTMEATIFSMGFSMKQTIQILGYLHLVIEFTSN